jgi:hypothetical protein
VLFGTVTLLIRFLPKIFSLFPRLLGLDAVRFGRLLVTRHIDLVVRQDQWPGEEKRRADADPVENSCVGSISTASDGDASWIG